MAMSSSQARSRVFEYLSGQQDTIIGQKTFKLNHLTTYLPDLSLPDIIEYTFQFINSVEPHYEIEKLTLSDNGLTELPFNLRLLCKPILYLDLHGNNFSEFPIELSDFTNLEFLDLSNNKLNYISKSRLSHLQNLKLINLKNNEFKYLPPILGELPNLNLIEVANNPLVLPSLDTINKFKSSSDLDWVKQLKNYLVTNSSVIESKMADSFSNAGRSASISISNNGSNSHSKNQSTSPNSSTSSTPQVQRSKSISETKTKASKAARRMGLIIKKPEDVNSSAYDDTQETETSMNSTEFPSPLNFPNSSSSLDTSFNLISPQLSNAISVGTSTMSTSSTATRQSHSQSHSRSNSPPITPVLSQSQTQLPKPRSRSNTLIEIDRMLETNDDDDGTEHKSGSYFRRLSTLAEVPIAETLQQGQHYKSSNLPTHRLHANSTSNVSSRNGSVSQPEEDTSHSSAHHSHNRSMTSIKTPPTLKSASVPNIVNTANQDTLPKMKSSLDINTVISVSRKILFSFSELHTSIRRFSGFSSDKKVTIKMVSYLYSAKSSIDSLVENLELVEDHSSSKSNESNKIIESLHSCISSFKSIMTLLSDNFQSFVNKIDICFIRMLYLTVFGSFNEIFNAYRILVPSYPAKLEKSKSIGLTVNTSFDSNGNIQGPNENGDTSDSVEDIDEKLYDSIDSATSKAQDVFGELTRAISRSAIASANETSNNDNGISSQLAAKVKELTNVCVTSMDIIKRLKTKSLTIRNNPSFPSKKLFWDDINLFLKTIIQTFSAVKNLMKDLPILNDIRPSMAKLTKSTKDVTILLEASSYKMLSNDSSSSHPPTLNSIPSVSNIFTPLTAHSNHSNLTHSSSYHSSAVNLSQLGQQAPVRTPLAAALGPAAQAILPLNNDNGSMISNSNSISSANLSNTANPITSPNNEFQNGFSTAPQSSGQYYANNGINPFDGIIMAARKTRPDDEY